MRRLILIGAAVMLSITSIAHASGNEGETPAWFSILEIIGVAIGIAVCVLIHRIYVGMRGGSIGSGFGKILIGVLAITAGIGINGLNETFGLIAGLNADLLFELLIYTGLIFIGIGVNKIARVAA